MATVTRKPKSAKDKLGWLEVRGSDGPSHYIDPAAIIDLQASGELAQVLILDGGHRIQLMARYSAKDILELIAAAKGVER